MLSRQHIPAVFHHLMTEEDSPIIDFYPTTFEIDMNGKKMSWQGVALLPFIDPKRLLEAMADDYLKLAEDEIHRNTWGNDVLFVADEHPLYPFFESLYGKRKNPDVSLKSNAYELVLISHCQPVPIDPKLSKGVNGSVLPNPDCIPGSTYYSPLSTKEAPDIKNDRSLSALYFFPKQLTPHRSVLLPGLQRPTRQLSWADTNATQRYVDRNGGRGRGGFDQRGGRGGGGGRGNYGNSNSYGNNERGFGGPGNNSNQPQPYQQRQPYQSQSQQGYGGYNSGARPPSNYAGQTYNSAPRGGSSSRGGPPNSQYGSYNSRGGGYASNSGGPPRGDHGGYGGYGGGQPAGGGRGGYGGYGGQSTHSYGGYGGSGAYNNDSRGRGGRGGY